ncbi:MAG: hypothetical protein ACYSWU_27025, partial [Planctomycetota bacterium]
RAARIWQRLPRRVMTHSDQTGGTLSKQFNRRRGFMQGARNLAWSYGPVLTAFEQRTKANTSAEIP